MKRAPLKTGLASWALSINIISILKQIKYSSKSKKNTLIWKKKLSFLWEYLTCEAIVWIDMLSVLCLDRIKYWKVNRCQDDCFSYIIKIPLQKIWKSFASAKKPLQTQAILYHDLVYGGCCCIVYPWIFQHLMDKWILCSDDQHWTSVHQMDEWNGKKFPEILIPIIGMLQE